MVLIHATEAFVIFFLILMVRTGSSQIEPDPNGYVVYCPCMGRFGNQVEHFLGALNFAKGLDRTLILPPWVEYHVGHLRSVQVPFDTYFQVEPLREYLPVILMEDFLKNIAPTIWPAGNRTVICYSQRQGTVPESCNAKDGNPFGSFWDTFNIDFDHSSFFKGLSFRTNFPHVAKQWHEKYAADTFPVMAFVGAPAAFPVDQEDVHLMQYVHWSHKLQDQTKAFLKKHIPKGPFVGVHMRNGADWVRACEHVDRGGSHMFGSPQCLGYRNEYGALSPDLCMPPKDLVTKQILKAVIKTKAKAVFVASDKDHMINRINDVLRKKKIKIDVMKLPETDNPHLDLSILSEADLYIGNCISTFSAIAARYRLTHSDKPTEFWAFTPKKNTKEEL